MAGAVSLTLLSDPLKPRAPTDKTHTTPLLPSQNAIFTGEQMLTTPCSGWDEDKAMLDRWGLRGLRAFEDEEGKKIDAAHVEVKEDGSAMLNAQAAEKLLGEGVGASS